MHLAILTNYPLFDNAHWKLALTQQLLQEGHQVTVIYGRSSPIQQIKAAVKKLKTNKTAISAARQRKGYLLLNNVIAFKKMGITMKFVMNLSSTKLAQQLVHNNVDYCICAVDQILTKSFIQHAPKLLNLHYGKLPEIKGSSAAEWTLAYFGKLIISLHYIEEGVDTGNILSTQAVNIQDCNNFAQLRNKIQEDSVKMYMTLFRQGIHSLTEKKQTSGQLYTFMHPDLKKILEAHSFS